MPTDLTPAVLAELKRLKERAYPPVTRNPVCYSLEGAYSDLIYALGEHADSLIFAVEERDNLRIYRDEADLIIENISEALFPDSLRDSRIAEFLLDGMGACQVIERLRAERDALQSKISMAQETGVRFCDLEGGGVGCSIPMSEELEGAMESIITLTDQRDELRRQLEEVRHQLAEARESIGLIAALTPVRLSDLHGCDPIREGSQETPEWENNPR